MQLRPKSITPVSPYQVRNKSATSWQLPRLLGSYGETCGHYSALHIFNVFRKYCYCLRVARSGIWSAEFTDLQLRPEVERRTLHQWCFTSQHTSQASLCRLGCWNCRPTVRASHAAAAVTNQWRHPTTTRNHCSALDMHEALRLLNVLFRTRFRHKLNNLQLFNIYIYIVKCVNKAFLSVYRGIYCFH